MQKGSAPVLVLVGILVLAIVAGGAYYYSRCRNGIFMDGKCYNWVPPPSAWSSPLPSSSPDTSPVPNGTGETANWKTFTDAKNRFVFKYPPGAKIENTASDLIYLTNADSGKPPYYLLSLEIKKQLKQSITADGFIYLELDELISKKEFPGAADLANKRLATLKSYQNGQINGSLIRGGTDGDSVTDFIEVIVVQKENIFKFVMHDGNGAVDDFQKKLMDQILSTFKFTD